MGKEISNSDLLAAIMSNSYYVAMLLAKTNEDKIEEVETQKNIEGQVFASFLHFREKIEEN